MSQLCDIKRISRIFAWRHFEICVLQHLDFVYCFGCMSNPHRLRSQFQDVFCSIHGTISYPDGLTVEIDRFLSLFDHFDKGLLIRLVSIVSFNKKRNAKLIRDKTEDKALEIFSSIFCVAVGYFDRIGPIWSITFVFAVNTEVSGINMNKFCSQRMPLHDVICDLVVELRSTVLVNRIKCSTEYVIGEIFAEIPLPRRCSAGTVLKKLVYI